jgi:hypothetical protein
MTETVTVLTAENVENTDVKDLAKVPEPPKPLTKKQIGQLRRRYITVVHGTVRACGHRFDPKRAPRMSNCEDCWVTYFVTAVDTAAVHDDLMKGGKKRLVSVYGKTFTDQFGKFLQNQMLQQEETTDDSQDHTLLPTGD